MAANITPSSRLNFCLDVLENFAPGLLARLKIAPYTCVVDTNVLLNDICYYVKKKQETGIVRAAKTGVARLIISPVVAAEVLEHLPELASERNLSADQCLSVWREQYEPNFYIIDPHSVPLGERGQELEGRDPKDVTLVQLVASFRPDVFLSEDKDLVKFDPIGQNWTMVSTALRDSAEHDEELVNLIADVILVSFATEVVGKLASEIVQVSLPVMTSALKRVPPEALAIGGLLAFGTLVHPTSQAYLQTTLQRFMEKIGTRGRLLLRWALREVKRREAAAAKRKKAGEFLLQCKPASEAPQSLQYHMVHVLSKSLQALTVQEIEKALLTSELLDPQLARHPSEMLTLLKGMPEFFSAVEGERWQIAWTVKEGKVFTT